jgi:glycosyltransferase involved in cell wall biosynthesis
MVPPRDALSNGTAGLMNWFTKTKDTSGYEDGNLNVEFMNYFSLPRPLFESIDEKLISGLFKKKLKNLVIEFNPDLIYCHWLRPWAGICADIAKELDLPFVIDHHEDLPTLKDLFPQHYRQFLEPFQKADRIIVHSSRNMEELKSELPMLENVDLIYLGQSLEVRTESKSFSADCKKLITVSHLYEPRKNIDVLIKALAKIKDRLDFSLRIVGDGSLRGKYEELTASLGLDEKITFTGTYTQDQIRSALDDSDLFILPSYPEAFGIVFAEALARGVPVVTCRGNGGGEELKLLGYPVILAEPHDEDDLAEKILLLTENPDAMNEMSVSGKTIVINNFTWRRNAERTLALMEELAANHKQTKHVRN